MNLKNIIDAEVEFFRPMAARSMRSTEDQRRLWRLETIRQRQERISIEIFDLLNGTVRYGPFKGLILEKDTWWGKLDLGSQCLGLYEKEILNFIEDIKFSEFTQFIDIGAADGYYAIGMLTSNKVSKSICFEQSEKGRETITTNWMKNGSMGEISIYGEANPDNILALLDSELRNSLVIIDIEGFEFDLLQLCVLEKLKLCTIIIEIHNWVDNFIDRYTKFLGDASNYFEIEVIKRVDRSTSELEELRDFTDDNRLLVTSERRQCLMRFLKLTPISL